MTVELVPCRREHLALWQDFVRRRGTLFHDLRWREVISGAYRLPDRYFLITVDGRLAGVAPFFALRGRLLLSLPYLPYAGMLLGDDEREDLGGDVVRQLLGNYNRVRIRRRGEAGPTGAPLFTMVKKLEGSADACFDGLHPKQRNMIRKAEQEPFDAVPASVDEFYALYVEATNQLGTPAHSKVLFELLNDLFAAEIRFTKLERRGTVMGAMVEIDYGDTRYDLWAFSLKRYFRHKPNVYLYWHTLRNAMAKGLSYYDFGRSSLNSGTYFFKSRWNAEPVPLHSVECSLRGTEVACRNFGGPASTILPRLWSLTPRPITDRLGPILRKHIP